MKHLIHLLLAAVPLMFAGGMEPYLFGPRAELLIPDEQKDWECALADSTDLTRLPGNLKWVPGNSSLKVKTAIRGQARYSEELFDSKGELKQKTDLTKWHRRIVDVPAEYLSNHAVFFTIATARLKFGLIVNGRSAGSSWQACLPKEMEVTRLLHPGKNEIAFAITAHEGLIDPKTRQWYAPHYSYGDRARWEGPIKLEFRPYCYIDDVFVQTFVKKREISFELTLKNVSERPVTVVPSIRVAPEQDPARPRMIVESDPVTVPARGEKVVTIRRPWRGPLLLWDPAGAHFYEADVLLTCNGKTQDVFRRKFGFREVSISGRDILLNGQRIFLTRDSIMGCSADFEKWTYGRWYKGKNAVNATRMHLGSLPYWLMESADRAGRFLIPELAYSFFNSKNRFRKEGVEEYCKGVAKRYRNHPSVILYSLANETVWHHTGPEWRETTEHYLRTMRKYAPNALFQADADNTWNGLLDINNIHYPEWSAGPLQAQYPNSGFNLPNDLWWVTREKGAPAGGWRTNPFDWSKPVVIGEFYRFAEPSIAGDVLYDHWLWSQESPTGSTPVSYYNPVAANPAEEALRMVCNYYRYVGFAGLNPWARDFNYVLEHTVMAPLEFQPNMTEGETLKRKVVFLNDGGTPVDTIRWYLRSDDKSIVRQGVWKVKVPQGEKWDGVVTAALPVRGAPWTARLVVQALMGTQEQARFEQRIHVMKREYDLSSFADRVGVIGRSMDDRLARMKLQKARRIGASIPPEVKVVIVAPDAFRHTMAPMLNNFFRAGGTVLMMPQKEWRPFRAELPERDLNHAATRSWIRSAGHPVLEGLLPEQLNCWGGDNLVSTATFRKPCEGSFRVLLECGGRSGMEWTSLVEVEVDGGSCILNSFPADSSDPAVQKLLANMIRYGVERPRETRRTLSVLPGKNRRILPFLKSIFAEVSESGGIPESGIVLADASAGLSAEAVRKILSRGGTVWLHNITPETRKILGDLLPADLRIVPRPKAVLGGIPVGNSALLNGIANFDLAWYRPPSNPERWSRAGIYWECSQQTAEPPVWCVESGKENSGVRLLTSPGFLAEIPSGCGRILLDALPWENAVDKEREKVMRSLAMLCRNLGVRFLPVVKPNYRYHSLRLGSFANMGYWDRVAGDGCGGWTDQGRNDMRMFLINHVGRNDYEEDGQPTPVPPFPEENIFCGVPFFLADPRKHDGKGVLSFGSAMAPKLMREVTGIPVGVSADSFHVLHASAWLTEKHGTPIAEYTLLYEDGSRATLPVRSEIDICDWWKPLPSANFRIAWAGRNKLGSVNLYCSTFRNPHPEKKIRSLAIRAGLTGAQYVVLGITFAEIRKEPGELVPVLKAKMDFSGRELLPSIPGCYYPPDLKFRFSERGAEFTEKNGCVVVFPNRNNPMKDFQRKPFEIVLEVTPLTYPTNGNARLFDLIGVGFQFHPDKRVHILNMKSKKILELNRKVHLRFRYDGSRAWLYVNGRLDAVTDASPYHFSTKTCTHFRFCNVNMLYHKVEFYELRETP